MNGNAHHLTQSLLMNETEHPSSISEETIGSGNHECALKSVQVHLAVKVRVVAGVLKVDYLVSLITSVSS